jgi:hypothetical protein
MKGKSIKHAPKPVKKRLRNVWITLQVYIKMNPKRDIQAAILSLEPNASCNILGSKILIRSPPIFPDMKRRVAADVIVPVVMLILIILAQYAVFSEEI